MKKLLLSLALALPLCAAEKQHDIVVYGGTSGGIIAAIQAAKSERSVVRVSPTAYLGGLTTSALGWTDLGSDAILGGLSREFYTRVYEHYQKPDAWKWEERAKFGNQGQGVPALNPKTQLASVFEPSVTTAVFNDMLKEHGVTVVTARLDLKNGVVMDGKRIQKIRTGDGREFAGKMFIDATYEGDLLPGAGVSFTVGREANATYKETINGIQTKRAVKNQLPDGIDPYIKPGDPNSGLLPGVNPDAGGEDGEGDKRLQAFCFRMCLTDVPANRVTIEKPESYDEANYEILFRAIAAGQANKFTKFTLMPNRKSDSNNDSGISNNSIGANHGKDWNWTTLNHDERLALAKQHEHWQRGLLWTLQNHPRVPENIRKQYSKWGLPKDEFTDNNHWPHQLYVREGRRMVSDFVMTEHHCTRKQPVPESIGLAAYTMDSHPVQRLVQNGMVKNEGDVQVGIPGPYPVSYRAIVPKRGECENLLVPWSLSASHMAFGSIRMEPVFMILSQSAATAADIALDRGVAVQDVPYDDLRKQLLEDDQRLSL
ncbi:MAG: FAD-dependent oxidoreductase [Luteolibacter sp.]